MDPDSERCRRTDGKKWRCRRNVVTGQKYCERHMHRGRLRSRKLVETSQLITASKAAPLNNSANNISEISNTTSSNPNPVNSVTRTSNADARIMGTITNLPARSTVGCVNTTATMITTAVHTDSTISAATMGTNKSGSNKNGNSNDIDDKKGDCGNKANLKNANNRRSSGRNITNASSATTQELDFSPKSVLQVQGCSSSCLYRSDAETGRCRRTDGKKWQCRRDVVPNEKYCKMHMHRGSKKLREDSQSLAHLSDTPDISTGTRLQHTTTVPNKGDHINLNSSLSMSISENPHLAISDEMSDTTISDTLVASFEDGDFSS